MSYNPNEPMPRQTAGWTCSAASTAWLLRSLGRGEGEWDAVNLLSGRISPDLGLLDGSGAGIVAVLRSLGLDAYNLWPGWWELQQLAGRQPVIMGAGYPLYHWLGVRSSDGEGLNLANSASGWQGLGDYMDYDRWLRFAPFAAVAVNIEQAPPQEDPNVIDELTKQLEVRQQNNDRLASALGYITVDVVAALRAAIAAGDMGAVEAAVNTIESQKPT